MPRMLIISFSFERREQSQPTQNSWKHNFMTLHKSQVTALYVQRFRIKTSDLPHCESSYDENQERWLNILQKQSSSAAVIFTPSLLVSPLSLLSSLISLSSPQTITMLTRSLKWPPGSLGMLQLLSHSRPRLPVFREAGILQTAPHTESRWRRIWLVLEFLRSRTDLRGQRWSPLSTCTQHVTTHHTCHLGTRQWSQDIWRLNHW